MKRLILFVVFAFAVAVGFGQQKTNKEKQEPVKKEIKKVPKPAQKNAQVKKSVQQKKQIRNAQMKKKRANVAMQRKKAIQRRRNQ